MVHLLRQVDEGLVIGDDTLVIVTDIDGSGVRLLAKGTLRGGPEDGARIERAFELGCGRSLQLGTLVTITLIDTRANGARLSVSAPPGISILRKEEFDSPR